nr:response regulator transcription factor [Nocardioides perillae]
MADDHALVRRGVRLILDAEPDLEVVAEVGDGRAALDVLRTVPADLLLLDVAMPVMTGLQAAREVQRRGLQVTVLMLSMHDNEQYFFDALRAGAAGYVLKAAADRDLLEACRAALRGETFLYPGTERALVREWVARERRGERHAPALLTAREDEVVKLVAEGHSTREIARLLVISPRTVERHRENVLRKLGLRDRTELTRYAVRVGLIEP